MATRPQQLVILGDIEEAINKVQAIARVYQLGSAPLDPNRPDVTTITITGAQQAALAAQFDAQVTTVKNLAATL